MLLTYTADRFYTRSPRFLVEEFIRLPSEHVRVFLPAVNGQAPHPVHAHTCMFERDSNDGYGELQGETITTIKDAVNSSRGRTFGISIAPNLA